MKPRSAAAIVLLAGLAWVAATHAAGERPTARPLPVPGTTSVTDRVTDAGDWIGTAVESARQWVTSLLDEPALFLTAVAVVAIIAAVRAVRARMPVSQDPQRMYSSDQRKEAFRRAGGQCEYTGALPWSRCRKPAEHADHLYPWSRGGATTLVNCVASCARHNTSKGAKILPAWQVRALVRRRRHYFPAGVDTAVGEKYADVTASASPARA